jgi:hypothetical protein
VSTDEYDEYALLLHIIAGIKNMLTACMKANDIPVKKEQWWNSLSNSALERVDGRKKDRNKDSFKESLLIARMMESRGKTVL